MSNAIFWLLEKIHGVVNNWGVAIIMVTCLIKAAFYKMSGLVIFLSKMKKTALEALKMHGDDREKLGQLLESYSLEKS